MGVAALAIDGGVVALARSEAQRAADAGALAGAVALKHEAGDAVAWAKTTAEQNRVCGGAGDVEVIAGETVTVTVTRTCQTAVAGLFGHPTFQAGARASAGVNAGHVRLVE